MPDSKQASMSAPKPSAASKVAAVGGDSADKARTKMHKRSRSGCFTCRLRRKKCDEGHPTCKACAKLCLNCEYKRPMWWASAEQRRQQKERVKNIIKQTKQLERRGSNQNGGVEHMDTACLPAPPAPFPVQFDFNYQPILDPYGPCVSQVPTPAFPPVAYPPQYAPYEIDVRTERQTFVNDVPFQHDSSVSTFSALWPPQLHTTLPNFHGDDWLQEDCFNQATPCAQLGPALKPQVETSTKYVHTSTVPVEELEERDRPLLKHFEEKVLRIIFPVLEVYQEGWAREVILKSLAENTAYRHCCLSVAAIHRDSGIGPSKGPVPLIEKLDSDTMRHHFEAIGQLNATYDKPEDQKEEKDYLQILDTTLAMILFHCPVSTSEDDLPDDGIPWSDHFGAVVRLVDKLEPEIRLASTGVLPGLSKISPFNMSLISWIDILGATMMGTRPHFADYYRTNLVNLTCSGLREVMGCDDQIMYLISEIASLEAAKNRGKCDGRFWEFFTNIRIGLENSEPADRTLHQPYTDTAAILPEQLTENISAIYRFAARIYLWSLVPGFDRNEADIKNLVSSVGNALAFIPTGPGGFDRSLVWPLLIAGAFSTPKSEFRAVLQKRVKALGKIALSGSFCRMIILLDRVWKESDNDWLIDPDVWRQIQEEHPILKQKGTLPSLPTASGMRRPMKKKGTQSVHWRDVINQNEWQHLLI